MRKLLRLVPILGLVAAIGFVGVLASQTQFDPWGLDEFETYGIFKVVTLDGLEITSPPLDDLVDEPEIGDPATVIGRSVGFREDDPQDDAASIFGGGAPPYDDTSALARDPCTFPNGFPEGPDARREVHTEILSLELTDGGFSVRAGQPYHDSAAADPTGPAAYFVRDSFGEVASLDPSGDTAKDFPADSFFNVFAEVEVPSVGNFYNLTPMVVRAPEIGQFPPEMAFPQDSYIHDPSFPAVPLFDENGIHRAYLRSAGHGGPDTGTQLPPVGDAPLLVGLDRPVTFSVDDGSDGLPTPTPSATNGVRDDVGQAVQQVTAYESSGATPGNGPDVTNDQVADLIGSVGGASPPDFAAGDAINSISFGRDGSGDTPGTLYFSVDRISQGQVCTDVRFNWEPTLERQAASIYTSGVSRFGDKNDTPVAWPPPGSHFMVIDATASGLRPMIGSTKQDNLTGVEVSAYEAGDRLYATFTGPLFTGKQATIYRYDPAADPFDYDHLAEFATAALLGLDSGDTIDALAVSATSNEVLFSLAPGSPTLSAEGHSPADIFYRDLSDLTGTFDVFATAASLGLLDSDNVDAIDHRPTLYTGGIAEPLDDSDSTAHPAPPEDSGASSPPYAALAGAAAAAALAIVAGGWYVRRRWLR